MARQVNKKDLTFVGYDDWCRAVYYNNKTKIYYKDVSLKGTNENIPNILNDVADNTFDGEPNNYYDVID